MFWRRHEDPVAPCSRSDLLPAYGPSAMVTFLPRISQSTSTRPRSTSHILTTSKTDELMFVEAKQDELHRPCKLVKLTCPISYTCRMSFRHPKASTAKGFPFACSFSTSPIHDNSHYTFRRQSESGLLFRNFERHLIPERTPLFQLLDFPLMESIWLHCPQQTF